MNKHANRIINQLGGTAEVARMFQIRMPSVSGWRQDGIPKGRMLFIKTVHPKSLRGADAKAATAVDRVPIPPGTSSAGRLRKAGGRA